MQSRSLTMPLLLLWLIGIALRLPILAVPPVIPALRSEFGLSGTEIGILTGLPVVLFAAAALAGSLLVARIGIIAAIVAGLLSTAFGSALRAEAPNVVTLFAATVVMGAGVAVTQPAIPALITRWMPARIGFATGVYTNGLLVGEIVPVALFPLLFAWLGGSWRATFVLWAMPVVAVAFVVMAMAPRPSAGAPGGAVPTATPSRLWPDWPMRDVWRLGIIFASANTMYFASNAFLPGYLSEAGRPDLISPALTALNAGQFPASLLLVGFARRLERRAWPFVLAGVLGLAGMAGIVTTASVVTVAGAAVLGFAAGGAFALGLTLPPLLSAPQEVARVSAAMFTISYTGAVAVSILCGAAWDLAGTARFAFLPIAFAALPSILLVPMLKFERRPGGAVAGEKVP